MSGKQAKAKRKTAKKAAANSAPASGGARLEEFIIGNVRCFAGEQRVPIRPITLLVGENSTGKTTFLGGYSIVHDLTMSVSSAGMPESLWAAHPPSFNSEPFPMGAFRDILNRNATRPQFQLGAKIFYRAIVAEQDWAKDPVRETRKEKTGKTDLVYSFTENGPNAAVHDASLLLPDSNYNEKIHIALGKHRYGGIHHLAIRAPGIPKHKNVGGYSRALYAHEIAIALSGSRDGKLPQMKPINLCLDRYFYPDASIKEKWRYLGFRNDSFAHAFSSERPRPARTYSPTDEAHDSQMDHVPMLLARMSRDDKRKWEALRKRLIAFGRESGMFSDFNVKQLGKMVSDPFQIQVEVRGVTSNILDVGYGVGQIYPLVTQVAHNSQRKTPATFLLQQPEIHLHPQAQAALAFFFAKSAREDGHTFIIETHGDSIIDRVRICVSNGVIPPEDVVILYFEPNRKTGAVKIHPIRMDAMANLLDVPAGYRDFFVKEDDLLLGFKKLPKGKPRVHHR